MKRPLESPSAPAQEPLRDHDGPRGLAQCPDVLTVTELCRELQISRGHYYLLVRHAQFPIRPLPLQGVTRYSRAAVQAFLNGAMKLQRVG